MPLLHPDKAVKEEATEESELLYGYRNAVPPRALVEPCACGLDIVCLSDDIATGVAAHQLMPEHRRWRLAGGMEAMVHGPSIERGLGVG